MRALRDSLAVGMGGAVGALLRYLVELTSPKLPDAAFVTLGINLFGAFAIGVLMEIFFQRSHASGRIRLALTTGLLGGFTTFGAMMVQAVELARDGLLAQAVLLGAGVPVLGVVVTLVGQSATRRLLLRG